MEQIFAVRTTYDEMMYYHQFVASKPRMTAEKEKKRIMPEIGISDLGMLFVTFFAFFMTFAELELGTRLLQSAAAAVLATAILHKLHEKKNVAKDGNNSGVEYDKKQARALLENSGLSGKRCTMVFGEESFTVENIGIITQYRYEGIAWIKETPKYFVIFWNRSLAIPVEKEGFYRGKKEQFGAFLEKKCQKTIEKVRVAA